MNNKETLQGYNNRLNDNNTSLNGILDIINELPEASGEVNLQDKEVTPTKETQVINYDEEYDGLNQVIVKPIPSEYVIPNLQNKSIEITENGTTNVTADEGYDGLNSVEVTTSIGGSVEKPAPMSISFENSTATTLTGFGQLDTTNITSMLKIFANCQRLTTLNLEGLDTSNVTNMGFMFNNCTALTELDVSALKTDKATSMSTLFGGCTKLEKINGLTNFNTSNVTTMYGLFKDCRALTELDLSNFNTSTLTNMSYMFQYCRNLTTIKFGNFNTSNVTNMSGLFQDCKALTELDLSSWDTSKVDYINKMFAGCTNLKKLDIRNWDKTNMDNSADMFSDGTMDTSVPVDCLIIVKDATAKSWITSKYTWLTNVKTVAELG